MNLGARALVRVFPRLQLPGSQRRQLSLEHRDAAPGGGHQLEGGLQGGAEGAVGLPGLAEQGRQRRQQVLHQLQDREVMNENQRAARESVGEERHRGAASTSLLSFRFTIRLS